MNEKAKEQIEKMKDLVMQLHRSAGNLDQMIQDIETDMNGVSNVDYLIHYIKAKQLWRTEIKRHCGFDNFAKDEAKIWNNLIKAIKEGS